MITLNRTLSYALKYSPLWLLLSALLACYHGCSGTTSPVADGNGSGTGVGNGVVVGKVTDTTAQPVSNATVRLRTKNFLADTSGMITTTYTDTSMTTTTDSTGTFIFDSIRQGRSFCIEVENQKCACAYGTLYNVTLNDNNKSDTVILSTRMLQKSKQLIGKPIVSGLPPNAYIQIYGIDRLGKTDSTGSFTIDRLPVGECERGECEYKLRVLVVNPDGSVKSLEYELEMKESCDTTTFEIEIEDGDENDSEHNGDYDD